MCNSYTSWYFYRPQRSWAKVMFLQACVCPQGGRGVCLSACWDTPRPDTLQPGTPLDQAPPQTRHKPIPRTRHHPPPGPGTPSPRTSAPPGQGTPPGPGPPGADTPPPGPGTPPPREADCSIRLTSGRYASYWNAFLLLRHFLFAGSYSTVTGTLIGGSCSATSPETTVQPSATWPWPLTLTGWVTMATDCTWWILTSTITWIMRTRLRTTCRRTRGQNSRRTLVQTQRKLIPFSDVNLI